MALDSNHVTKLGELKQLIDGLWSKVTTAISNAVSGLLSKSEADAAYQAKGSYATQSELNSLGNSLSGSIGSINAKIPSNASETNKLVTAADIPDVPTNVSAFENDAGYITSETDPVFSASAAAGITSSDIAKWNGKEIEIINPTSDVTYDDVIAIINAGKIPVVRYTYVIGVRTFEKYLFPDYYRNQSTGYGVVFSNVSEDAFVLDSSQVEVVVDGGMILTAWINRKTGWSITKKSLLVSKGRPTYPAGDVANPIYLNNLGEPTPTNWEFHWSSSGKTFNVSELPLTRSYLFFNTSTSANATITIINDLSKSVTVTNLNKNSGTSGSVTLSIGQSSNQGAVKKCGGMGLVIRQNETSIIIIREI